MNVCEPGVVFLMVANGRRGHLQQERQDSSACPHGRQREIRGDMGIPRQRISEVNCGTMDVWRAISNACMNDPNVSMCSKAEFLAGGKQSREDAPNG